MNRKIVWFALALLAALALSITAPAETAQPEPLYLTLEELSQFNGKDGQPAYVAVDGVIYDMTKSVPWKNGEHNGQQAGKDLTREINEISPHGVAMLERVPAVGRLVVEMTPEELSQFNGKDGQRAYVAVNGLIYDVTDSDLWKDGGHMGMHEAGNELTREITEDSPHGLATLERVPVVGRLVLSLSAEELAQFDGLEGRKAYIAYMGTIYDVSEHPSWEGGAHYGIQAGQDVTEALDKSPHGAGVISQAKKVGVLKQ